MADTIFTFIGNGKVNEISYGEGSEMQADNSRLCTVGNDKSSEKEKQSDQEKARPSPKLSATQTENVKRQKGDRTLYSYYLRSAGAVVLLLWVLSISLAALGERLPRKTTLWSKINEILTNQFNSEIYVRIWTHEDPFSKTFFAGFAALGAANVAFAAMSTS